MRQNVGTIALVISLMVLFIEACCDLSGMIKCWPLIRALLILFITMYVMYHGEMNRREYNAKARKIKELKEQEKKAKWLQEYEEFRREKHAS